MPEVLDARGLVCPEPVLRTAKAMRAIAPGDTLTVLASDPASAIDLPYYCHHAGLELVALDRAGEQLTFRIRRPARLPPLPARRPIG